MDLTKLTDEDLDALSRNDLSSVSDAGLAVMAASAPAQKKLPSPKSAAYIAAWERQNEGRAIGKEEMDSFAARAASAGVSEDDFTSLLSRRPSFEVDKQNPAYFTTDSGARNAGPIEEIGLAFAGDEARNKAREQGVFSPSLQELSGQYADNTVDAIVNAASFFNPITAEMTAAKVLSTAAKTALISGIGSTYKSARRDVSGIGKYETKDIAADVFDSFSSATVEGFTSPWAKGTLTKPLLNGLGAAVFGLSQGVISSSIRGENSADALQRMAIAGGASGFSGVLGGISPNADEAKVAMKLRQRLIESGIPAEQVQLGFINSMYAPDLMRAVDSNEAVRDNVAKALTSFNNARLREVGGFTPMTTPSVMIEQINKRAGVVPALEAASTQAGKNVEAAKNALNLAKQDRSKLVIGEAKSIASSQRKAKIDALNREAQYAIDSYLSAFTPKQFAEAVGGASTSPLVAQQARANLADQAEASYKTFKAVSNEMHDLIPDGNFDAAKVVSSVEEAIDAAPEEVKKQVSSLLKNIPFELDENGKKVYSGATRTQLINARNGIFDLIGIGGAPTASDHYLSKASSAITDSMDLQKVEALGAEGAEAWDAARAYYRNIEAFKDGDVRTMLFGKNDNTPLMQSLIRDIQDNGIGAGTRYAKMETALSASGNTQLAEVLKVRSRDAVRSYVMDLATNQRGEVNPKTMLSALGDMRKRPDALQAFGFGNSKTWAILEDAVASYPDASKMTKQQVDTLMSLPNARGNLASLPKIKALTQDLATQHAESQIGKAALFEAMGNNPQARKSVYEARKALTKAGLDEKKANELLFIARNEAMPQSFAKIRSDYASYDQFYSTFASPSGPLANADLKAMMTTLQRGKREDKLLAQAMQTRFLNDVLMGASNGRDPERALSLFVEALKPNKDSKSLYQRASAMFTPQQLVSLRKSYEDGLVLAKFIGQPKGDDSLRSGIAAAAGTTAATIGGVRVAGQSMAATTRNAANLIARGKYALANSLFASNPEGYLKTKDAVGEMAKFLDNLNFAQRAQFYMQNESSTRQLEESK